MSPWTTEGESSISVSSDYSRREQNFCLCGLQWERVAFLYLWTTEGKSSISVSSDHSRREQNFCLCGLEQESSISVSVDYRRGE